MGYLGNTPTTQNFISGTDYFNGDGSTTAFTLSRTVNSVNDIEAVINNVVQQPNTAYTLSGTTITFTSAPSAGTSNIYVRYLSTTTQVITPSQNTVSYSTMNTDMQGLFAQSFTNRIINGAMMIDQRNAGATISGGAGGYSVDRWNSAFAQSGKFNYGQSTTAPTGFVNSLIHTVAAAYTSGAGDYFLVQHFIEGLNVADLAFGTASATNVTVSFWVRSSVTGTYSVAIANGSDNRAYTTTFTVNSANTFEYKSVTIPGDQSGTWATNTGKGISVKFDLGSGSNYVAGSTNAWVATNTFKASGSVSLVANAGATFYITGVQLEKGSTATSFDYRPYGTELALCQRYYETSATGTPTDFSAGFGAPPYSNNTQAIGSCRFQVSKRSAPTVTLYDGNGSSGNVSQVGVANGIAATAAGITIAGFNYINRTSGSFTASAQNPVCGGYVASAEL